VQSRGKRSLITLSKPLTPSLSRARAHAQVRNVLVASIDPVHVKVRVRAGTAGWHCQDTR